MKRIASKPTNGDIDLGFTHQLAIVNDADEQTGEHQPDRHLRIDCWTAIFNAIAVDHFFSQPRQVEDAVDAGQHMFVWNELPE